MSTTNTVTDDTIKTNITETLLEKEILIIIIFIKLKILIMFLLMKMNLKKKM